MNAPFQRDGKWFVEMLGAVTEIAAGEGMTPEQFDAFMRTMAEGATRHDAEKAAAVQRGDWRAALLLCNSEERPLLIRDLWKRIPATEKATALAEAIASGDAPIRNRRFLVRALRELRTAGEIVFDGAEARQAFAALAEDVTIYRGTIIAEGSAFGICWTADAGKAEWFATQHHRFRNTESPPVVLRAEISKADIAGLLWDRGESEVLVIPDVFKRRRPVAVPMSSRG